MRIGNADVNQAVAYGRKPLFIAAEYNYLDEVRFLIASRTNVDQACADGATRAEAMMGARCLQTRVACRGHS